MGLLEDAFKGWTGLAVGLGVAYVAPAVLPAVGAVTRPLVKGVMKTGFMAARSMREYAAEAAEEVGDLYAEVEAESRGEGAGNGNGRAITSTRSGRRRRRTNQK
jgi:Protein of unknown function (DUF5132)